MRKNILGWALSLSIISSGAQATILNFNEIPGTEAWTTQVNSQGFSFTSDHIHTYGAPTAGYEDVAYNGTTKLGYEGEKADGILMRREDNATFSLLSLDAAEFFRNNMYESRPNASVLQITAQFLDSSIASYQLQLDGVVDGIAGQDDFQHFVLPSLFTNVYSVLFTGLRLDGGSGGISLDNLEVADDPVSVPEPATLSLMGLSLIGVALARRRKVTSN